MMTTSKESTGTTRSTTKAVYDFICKRSRGNPFSTFELLHLGKRTAIDKVLSRLAKEGVLIRLRPGMYVFPEKSALFGTVPPSVGSVLKAITRKTGERFEASGPAALSALGLTTQNQAEVVFSTTGKSRIVQLHGVPDVTLKRVPVRGLEKLAGSTAGMALVGLIHLGRDKVDNTVLHRIKNSIPKKEFERLGDTKNRIPQWLVEKLSQFAMEGKFGHD